MLSCVFDAIFNIWAELFIIVAVLVGSAFFYGVALPNKGLSPGPLTFPVIGNCWWYLRINFWMPLVLRLELMVLKHGRILTLYRPTRKIPYLIVLAGYETQRQGPIENPDYFADARPERTLIKNKMRPVQKPLLEYFKNNKNTEDMSKTDVQSLKEYFQNQHGKPSDPTSAFYYAIANIMSEICFGRSFSSKNDPDFLELTKLHQSLADHESPQLPLDLSDFDDVLAFDAVVKTYTEWVKKQVAKCKSSSGPVLEIMKNQLPYEEDVVDVCSELHRFGTETLSATLNWGIIYMTSYSIVQERVQKELDDVIGETPRNLTVADLANLPYTTGMVKEILRLSSVMKFEAKRVVKDGLKIMNYNIPKGSLAVLSLVNPTRDPQYFAYPFEVRPDRWIRKEDEKPTDCLADKLYDTTFTPDRCLMPDLPLPLLTLFLGTLLHQFEFVHPDTPPRSAPAEGMGSYVWRPLPYNVVAKPRGH